MPTPDAGTLDRPVTVRLQQPRRPQLCRRSVNSPSDAHFDPRSPGRFTHRGLSASGSCSGERGNVLGVGNYCYVVVCSALGASAPTEGGEGQGHIVAATRLQLALTAMMTVVFLQRGKCFKHSCISWMN